jgi:hypothetical protein
VVEERGCRDMTCTRAVGFSSHSMHVVSCVCGGSGGWSQGRWCGELHCSTQEGGRELQQRGHCSAAHVDPPPC